MSTGTQNNYAVAEHKPMELKNGSLQITNFNHVKELALICSAVFPGIKKEELVLRILTAQKLGLDPLESISEIYFVKGQPSVKSFLINNRIKQSKKYRIKVIESNEERAVLDCFDEDELKGRIEIEFEKFKKMIPVNQYGEMSNNWTGDRELMLFYKAINRAYKKYFPDLFSIPVQSYEELKESEEVEKLEQIKREALNENQQPIDAEISHEAEIESEEILVQEAIGEVEEPQPEPREPEKPLSKKDKFEQNLENLNNKMSQNSKVLEKTIDELEPNDDEDEKPITTAQAVQLNKLAQRANMTTTDLVSILVAKFKLSKATWNKQLTQGQFKIINQIIEKQIKDGGNL